MQFVVALGWRAIGVSAKWNQARKEGRRIYPSAAPVLRR
jgi:hypothetical protein